MRFMVDAQLPRLLATQLASLGHDAIHVMALPEAGDTRDAEITAFADDENRIVVTKDVDFTDSHLLHRTPRQLLRITTGNIKNADLLPLVERHLGALEQAFTYSDFVEFGQSGLVVHPRRAR